MIGFLQTTIMVYHKVIFYVPGFLTPITYFSYTVCLYLLVTISTGCRLRLLFPIWSKCHHPGCTSVIACALLWSLNLGLYVISSLFFSTYFGGVKACVVFLVSFGVFCAPLFLALSVSSLTLLLPAVKSHRVFLVIQGLSSRSLWGLPTSLVFLASHIRTTVMASLLTTLPFTANSGASPIIYFFAGSLGKKRLKEPLRKILQRALSGQTELGRSKRAAGVDPAGTPGSPQGTGGCLPMKHRSA